MTRFTDDIHTIYASLDSLDQDYIELTDDEFYQQVRHKWLVLSTSDVLYDENGKQPLTEAET
ncbi:hypothetical protein [uncultured Shewanella sp.]|uniref:hypothetical protein n=1 Tax=uncultured Shewanella sp. TaxID=173975 RepID=UPI00261FE7F8|nr:hypothetical protein [uncultured Shewanella sp.]